MRRGGRGIKGNSGGVSGHASGPAAGHEQATRDLELKSEKMSEDKVALSSNYSYAGVDGEKLQKTIRGYFLARFPGIRTILE